MYNARLACGRFQRYLRERRETLLAKKTSKKTSRAGKVTRVKSLTKKAPRQAAPPTKRRPPAAPPATAAVRSPAATPAQNTAGETLSEAELRKAKSGLTRKDLEHYREVLLQKRAELLGDVESLQVDVRNNGGNLSNLPLHMADVGSDNYQQEFTLGLVESDRKTLREIDEALVRMERGYYGVCIGSGKPIGKPRLDIKPWAKYCIEVVRDRERRGLPV